ncbi:MAG: isocitrate lyase [Deltaproteobacteria bacterium RIFCSPLOWO2_01_44_7]|nr:MAG: isocitrate lyase [Deltaproteobacteria bacterium RIFCSPHIGHO2_01_FULL_43_49]OGQ14371.1 MAG: isocitrate lyase [Deltaproteobacteria bacterium RIFCSPHIGHO2_02_FULL_44_53]OGQ27589.1 MAG: isocitrate lyase [Deltaproteobacteria bacterium RIFCSPHIGHO2_12_FULL_44_21]OGQ30812.1 MAG: isocitrate lyase [Deltaproteobacteria bacterium RIFCSPLOWO2_01_FULL_45_74]OGQ40575.1 MAG: isocitrate lyase [Deltaproteobacteria bacterium RIFCSPLOWO2_01_44_7]OGQ42493.1 MAG: isocitrate lyase [Deltaproteobacteria bacte
MLDAHRLEKSWSKEKRWEGITRPYSAEDVVKLKGSVHIEYTLAKLGAERLWNLLNTESFVSALGALTGNQAMQMVKAGLKAIYLSGWQVAADANLAGQMYPDQSLYPANSVPNVVRKINQTLQRADQIHHAEGNDDDVYWFAPIVADAEAGFGGPLNAFELMKAMIEAGTAAVHFEDQLSSEKKCGHMGGKVLLPTSQFIRTLTAARLAADVMGVPTVLIARTDANGAFLITSDTDPRDKKFLTGERTPEGFFRIKGGLDAAIARGIAYAPYADMVWCETAHPDLNEAKKFAEAVQNEFPGKLLAYNCSPSFNWKKNLDDATIKRFQRELAAYGYKFQFITLAGFHALNYSMFELALDFKKEGMPAYVKLQEKEFATEKTGYTATKHQREVGTGYFDQVVQVISHGLCSTTAMGGSTEKEQFKNKKVVS